MADWQFTPITYDGVSIQGSAPFLKSYFLMGDQPMAKFERKVVELGIPGDYSFPEVARQQPSSGYITLRLDLSATNQSDLYDLRRLFDRQKGDVVLVVKDGDNLDWKVTVRLESLQEAGPNRFRALLYMRRPIFDRTANSNDGPRALTAASTTWDLAVGGNVRNHPDFVFTPTAAKGAAIDFRFGWYCNIAWRSELEGEDSLGGEYPIDIANDAFDTATEVAAGRMQSDGDDLRVFVDGEEYERTLDGMNGATTKVWVGIHFSPSKSVMLGSATGAAVPADGASWPVQPGQSLEGWPAQGFFRIENEVVWYGQRTDYEFQLIDRGYRGSTAAAHTTLANNRADWIEHDIQIVSGNSALTAPAVKSWGISTSLSTNLAHTYNIWLNFVNRYTGEMMPRFTEDNIRSAALSIHGSGIAQMRFADRPAGGVWYPYNNMELYVPCGVKEAAGALAFDASGGDVGSLAPESDIVVDLRVYGVDVNTGVEALLATYRKKDRTGAKTLTPDAVLSRVRFNALYNVITGAFWDPTFIFANQVVGVSTDALAQRLSFREACAVHQWAIYGKESAAGDTAVPELALVKPTGGNLNAPIVYWIAAIPNATFGTTYRWAETVLDVPVHVPAGTDWYLTVHEQPAGAGAIHWAKFYSIYAGGEALVESASVWTTQYEYDYGFLAIGDGTYIQDDAPSGMEGYASVDNVVVTFDDTTPRTPSFQMSARRDIYPIRGRMEHVDLGFYFDLFYIATLNESVTIRTRTKEVILNETLKQYAPGAITPSDAENWFYLRGTGGALDNTVRYVEATAGGGSSLTSSMQWQDAIA